PSISVHSRPSHVHSAARHQSISSRLCRVFRFDGVAGLLSIDLDACSGIEFVPCMPKAEPLGHVLKVQLDQISPPIWRRLEIPVGCTLGDIHHLFQTVMDWDNSHLHVFVIKGVEYGFPDPGIEMYCE